MTGTVLYQSRTQSNACARARMALALGKLTTGTPKFRGSGFVGMHVKPITAQEKFNFPRANAILARAQALLWLRDWSYITISELSRELLTNVNALFAIVLQYLQNLDRKIRIRWKINREKILILKFSCKIL